MLLWAILLQAVPLKPENERVEPVLPRLLDLAEQQCGEDCGDSPRRFRLEVAPVETGDAKRQALRGAWQPCGTTGAPVCPSKGRVVLKAEL